MMKLSICSVAVVCVLAFAQGAHAETNIVVLNSTSGDITVSCNATGKIPPGDGGWSCVDAKIITASGDTYSVKDTHGHGTCAGGAWDIQYINEKSRKVIYNACTPLGFGQIGCHVVQVTDQGLRVDVQGNDNACAGQYATQIGPKIYDTLVKSVTDAKQLLAK